VRTGPGTSGAIAGKRRTLPARTPQAYGVGPTRDGERADLGIAGQSVVPSSRQLSAVAEPKISVVSTGVAERLAEQKAMRRHRLLRRVIGWTVAVALLAGVSWVVFASSLLSFDADHLVVRGTGTTVDMASVVEVAKAQEGTSLALINMGVLHDEILKVPNIRDVTITRQWPTGLAVEVVAREPVAVVPVEGGFALLDKDAVTVSTVPEAPADLPLITIELTGNDRRTLDAALTVIESLPSELAAEVGSVSAATQDAVTLTLRDGVVVEWGGSSDSALKVQVLAALRSAEVSRDARVFDVSAPTFPITR
jgi:cell division protein FtsQ